MYVALITAKTSKFKIGESSSSGKVSVLTSQKSSSTPSLPEAMDGNNVKPSFASTEQASSADSLLVSKVAELMAESVLSNAQSDLTLENNIGGLNTQDDLHPGCSFAAAAVAVSDLATIVEERNTAAGAGASSAAASGKGTPISVPVGDISDDDAFLPSTMKPAEASGGEGIPTARAKPVRILLFLMYGNAALDILTDLEGFFRLKLRVQEAVLLLTTKPNSSTASRTAKMQFYPPPRVSQVVLVLVEAMLPVPVASEAAVAKYLAKFLI
jgi:hypothetical protein